jgi:hypothetical protein
MSNDRACHVAVLGACCSGDAFRPPSDFGALGSTWYRLIAYQGRTAPTTTVSSPLDESECRLVDADPAQWGVRMVMDELRKRHVEKLLSIAPLVDVLVLDLISAFTFAHLVCDDGRSFLQSWEWQRHVTLSTAMRRVRLWDIPLSATESACLSLLDPMVAKRPDLSIVLHVPDPSFYGGACFDDGDETASRIDFYYTYCDFVHRLLDRHYGRVKLIAGGKGRADPSHPHGLHPFNFDVDYLTWVRGRLAELCWTPFQSDAEARS